MFKIQIFKIYLSKNRICIRKDKTSTGSKMNKVFNQENSTSKYHIQTEDFLSS